MENFLRFYKLPDAKCPPYLKGEEGIVWYYEKTWSELNKNKDKILDYYVLEYKLSGLQSFESDDDTPLSLKALLFNRHSKGTMIHADAVLQFKKWYVDVYRKSEIF